MRLDLFLLNMVLFPRMRMPLHIFEPRYREMIGRCIAENAPFGVVLIKEGDEAGPPAVPHDVGTTARIFKTETLEDGRMNIAIEGQERFRIDEIIATEPHVIAEVTLYPLEIDDQSAVDREAAEVRDLFTRGLRLLVELQGGFAPHLDAPSNPERLAIFVAAGLPLESSAKQALLEIRTTDALLEAERRFIAHHLPDLDAMVDRRWAARAN